MRTLSLRPVRLARMWPRPILKAGGSVDDLTQAAAFSLWQAAMKDGVLDPAKAEAWRNQRKSFLSQIPDAAAKFGEAADAASNLKTAQQNSQMASKLADAAHAKALKAATDAAQSTVDDALANKAAEIKRFQKSVAGGLTGAGGSADVIEHVWSVLNGKTAVAYMAHLARLTENDPEGRAAVQATVRDHILKVLQGDSKGGSSTEGYLFGGGLRSSCGKRMRRYLRSCRPSKCRRSAKSRIAWPKRACPKMGHYRLWFTHGSKAKWGGRAFVGKLAEQLGGLASGGAIGGALGFAVGGAGGATVGANLQRRLVRCCKECGRLAWPRSMTLFPGADQPSADEDSYDQGNASQHSSTHGQFGIAVAAAVVGICREQRTTAAASAASAAPPHAAERAAALTAAAFAGSILQTMIGHASVLGRSHAMQGRAMAAPAKTVFVTRSSINADAMSWPSKPSQDSGLYVVDIRPLLKAEQIALGSFVAMPINGLCVSTNSSLGGVLVLTISGGVGHVYKLQFVFSDTEGHIEVFQVSLPVGADMSCVLPNSSRGATGIRGLRVRLGQLQRRAVRRGFLDRLVCLGRPAAWIAGRRQPQTAAEWSGARRELVIYRPGAGFFYVTASLLNPNAIIFDDQDAVFGGVPLSYGTGAAAEVTFNGVPVVVGNTPTSFTTAPAAAVSDIVFAGQAVTFGTQARTYTGATTALVFGTQPVTVNAQPAVFNAVPAQPVLFQSQVVNADGQLAVFA